jgi:hypothetical protein
LTGLRPAGASLAHLFNRLQDHYAARTRLLYMSIQFHEFGLQQRLQACFAPAVLRRAQVRCDIPQAATSRKVKPRLCARVVDLTTSNA